MSQVRPDLVVEQGCTAEWPQIAAMREEHYLRTRVERVPTPSEAKWLVAREGPQVVACAAYLEYNLNGLVIVVSDFYTEQSRLGKLGAKRLIQRFDEMTKGKGRITSIVPLTNTDFLNVLVRSRGYWPVAIRVEKDNRARPV